MELEKIQRTTEMIRDVEQLLYKENTEKSGTFQIEEETVEGEKIHVYKTLMLVNCMKKKISFTPNPAVMKLKSNDST